MITKKSCYLTIYNVPEIHGDLIDRVGIYFDQKGGLNLETLMPCILKG